MCFVSTVQSFLQHPSKQIAAVCYLNSWRQESKDGDSEECKTEHVFAEENIKKRQKDLSIRAR